MLVVRKAPGDSASAAIEAQCEICKILIVSQGMGEKERSISLLIYPAVFLVFGL
ncbi:hypothetical protein [Paenibacillus sp. 1P07SE]|uniref:hypothetical protein n=1 Tax=Paenibacillus sp. 1P07SE TaxID=3132209 RepID=UPI0039A51E3D